MSGPSRVEGGSELDRGQCLDFSFDGRSLAGFAGDTIASALLANGVRIVGRSFKYHRPRGVFSAGGEEPNAIVDLRDGARHDPNARATIEPLRAGMEITSTHARGSAARDSFSFLDRFARFIPAGFYYKTFMWPGFRVYEAMIRKLAGIGRVDANARAETSCQQFLNVEVCVIGGGPAGIAAALAAAHSGRQVLLVDDRAKLGGGLRWREVGGGDWADACERELRVAGVRLLASTTALGLYDHNALVLVEKGLVEKGLPATRSGNGECLWRLRAQEIILASGAIERPLLFENNDRPGVMLADAALSYLRQHGVRCGERAVIATNNDSAYELAHALRDAGADCVVVDARAHSECAVAARAAGIEVHLGETVVAALGQPCVEGAQLASGKRLNADLIAVSGGWTPLIHLYCHARGKPRWDERIGTMVPGSAVPGLRVVGAANGELTSRPLAAWGSAPDLSATDAQRRVWVDLQHDVTSKDIDLAVRENFASVEHLKRYTTLGMATDQGKTSNLNGLALLAARTGRDIAAVGITTFRPPFLPVSMATVAGKNLGELQAPIRRLPAENAHRAEGAYLRDYGNLLRPAWYGDEAGSVLRECERARSGAVVFDASSLGKIEVLGPNAAALLDFIYYTRMSTLAPGRLRYGIALDEGGAVWDDGVVLRLAPQHFVVSCSSSHVAAMVTHLEEWREDRFALGSVFVHDASAHWATLAISGPQCKRVIAALELGIALDDAALPHMAAVEGRFGGRAARIARVSFTGERCYEVSVPARLAMELWRQARAAGAGPLGLEALGVLRAEKGYIFVGQDTDSETMPQDLGLGGPREKRKDAYLGDRSLFTAAAIREGRKQLVGIAASGAQPIPVGAHPVETTRGKLRSVGFVTSSGWSPSLSRPIALGLVEDGRRRLGETLIFEHLGTRFHGTLVAPCFLDPEGARLHV